MMQLFPLRPLLLTLFMALVMTLVFAPAMAQNKAAKVDAKAADPQDPFVRGLQRLDEKLRMPMARPMARAC
jgi:hypothetical protein